MKKILMLLAFAGVASVASAQQTVTVTEYEVIQVQDKHQVITNPFWSNWFFSVGGGAQVLFGNNDHILFHLALTSQTPMIFHLFTREETFLSR